MKKIFKNLKNLIRFHFFRKGRSPLDRTGATLK